MKPHPEIPVRVAIEEYLRKVRRPKGKPKTMSMQMITH